MNIRDRLIEIVRDSPWRIDLEPHAQFGSIAEAILEEFWPIPKEYFDCKTLTDGTVVFEPKPDDVCDCGCCG